MNHPNTSLDQLITTFIAKSRKNSNEHHPINSKDSPDQTLIEHTQQEEYIILEEDLKEFVQKIAASAYEKDTHIELLSNNNTQLQNNLNLAEARIAVLTGINNSNLLNESKENTYKKNISELQGKVEAEKKKREHLQKQIKWGNNKIKEHINQIQRLKQRITNKDIELARLREMERINNLNNTNNSIEIKQTSSNFITPAKIDSNFNDPTNFIQSIQSSQFGTDFVAREKEECPKHILETGQTKGSHKDQSKINLSKLSSLDKQKPQLYQEEKNAASKANRYSDTDRKDRLLHLLGEKCLHLESHIEILTKKILGYIIAESPSKQNIKKTEQFQNRFLKGAREVRPCLVDIQNEDDMPELDID